MHTESRLTPTIWVRSTLAEKLVFRKCHKRRQNMISSGGAVFKNKYSVL